MFGILALNQLIQSCACNMVFFAYMFGVEYSINKQKLKEHESIISIWELKKTTKYSEHIIYNVQYTQCGCRSATVANNMWCMTLVECNWNKQTKNRYLKNIRIGCFDHCLIDSVENIFQYWPDSHRIYFPFLYCLNISICCIYIIDCGFRNDRRVLFKKRSINLQSIKPQFGWWCACLCVCHQLRNFDIE